MKYVSFLPVSVALLLLCSCKKEGCTDSSATNFDAEARKNNNSCTYQGEAVFWFGRETSENLQLNAVTSLKYYVDDQLEGSSASDVYFSGAPACGQNGSISVTRDLGGEKRDSHSYRVEDQLGRIIWQGNLDLEGGVCLKQELVL